MYCSTDQVLHKNQGENKRKIPIVGIVVTISPSFSLYKIVVFPAASNPTMRILISFLPNRLLKSLPNTPPISKVNSSFEGYKCAESSDVYLQG